MSALTPSNLSGLSATIIGYLGAAKDYMVGLGSTLYNAIVAVDWGSIGRKVLDSLGSVGSQIAGIFANINFGDIGASIIRYFDGVNWAVIGDKIGEGIKSFVGKLGNVADYVKNAFASGSYDSIGTDIGNAIKGAIGKISGWGKALIDVS